MTIASTRTRLRTAAVVAVLRGSSPDDAIEVAEVLAGAGLSAIEVTFTTPDACVVMRELSRAYGDQLCLGAGTITTPAQADDAVASGAEFLVSPGCPPELVGHMRATGRLAIPGVLTPTDVMTVAALDMNLVKLFPASALGPAHLSGLRTVFPGVQFMPTGGIELQDVVEWFAAGAFAVGVGGGLAPARVPDDHSRDQLRGKAAQFQAAASAARQPG